MATTDDLVVSIRADITDLQRQLRRVDDSLGRTEESGRRLGASLQSAIGGLIGLGVAVEGLKKLVDVNRELGILKAGLETATGSAKNATIAFNALQDFAKTTPYDLAQATEAFTKLVNLGLTPSEEALRAYGDTSAALGKDLNQMIEAVADAATGEFERLKEFGIKAKQEGDKVSFTFKGVTETVAKNAADIENYLIKLGQVNFAGAMEKRMQSLDGAISNLGDSWDALFRKLGDSGLTQVINQSIGKVTATLDLLTKKLDTATITDFNNAVDILFDSIAVLAGVGLTRLAAGFAVSTQAAIQNMIAQRQLSAEALQTAEADSIAANMAVRRSVVERELAITEVNRARAENQLAITALATAQADAQATAMNVRLAQGTAQAEAAALAHSIALDRVAQAQVRVTATAQALSVSVNNAAIASGVHTQALAAQTAAQTTLNGAQATANTATRTATGLITALGGPLGASITLLGLAATAWMVFGDNAQTAAEKALEAGKRIKDGFSGANDALIQQQNGLAEVNGKILKLTKTIDEWNARGSGIRLIDKETELAALQQQKKAIEENINLIRNQSILDEFLSENKTDTLGQFGTGKKPTAQVDSKEQKKLDELKKASAEYLNQLNEATLSELQLEVKHYQESIAKLNDYLQKGAITREQYQQGVYAANEAYNNKTLSQLEEQFIKEQELQLKQQEQEDAARTVRMAKIQEFIEQGRQAGMSELEYLDAQHAEKMNKLAELAEGEVQFKQQLRDAELLLEQEHQAKRLDLILGTGNKMQGIQKAFQKSALDGALAFFAADFGGMSQHSRKMFELQKAAKTAQIILNTPSAVSAAMQAGWTAGSALGGIGAPALAAAYGAAALAQQLGQLRAIQSASYSGGSSGGGGSAGGSFSVANSQPEQQQPIQQRFVNISLAGSENTMYSKDGIRSLIERINDEVKDGAVIRVV